MTIVFFVLLGAPVFFILFLFADTVVDYRLSDWLRNWVPRRDKKPPWLAEYDLPPETLAELYDYNQLWEMYWALRDVPGSTPVRDAIEEARALIKMRQATKEKPA